LFARALLLLPDGFQQVEGAEGVGLGGVNGDIEADADVGLGAEVVDFVRVDQFDNPAEGGAVGEVSEVELELRQTGVLGVRVDVEMVEAVGIEGAGTAHDAVDLIAFGEEEFGQVRTVLSCYTGDEGGFHGSTIGGMR
jgi:hypothetical protein